MRVFPWVVIKDSPFIEAPKSKRRRKANKQEVSASLESETAPALPLDGGDGSADDGKVSSSQTDSSQGKTAEPAKKATRAKPRNYFKPHNGCEFSILLPERVL